MQLTTLQPPNPKSPDWDTALHHNLIDQLPTAALTPIDDFFHPFAIAFDPEAPLTRGDFMQYLARAYITAPIENVLDADPDGDYQLYRDITWVEMARAAYRLRGVMPDL